MTTRKEMEKAIEDFKRERRALRLEIRRVLSERGYITRDGERAEQIANKMTRKQ